MEKASSFAAIVLFYLEMQSILVALNARSQCNLVTLPKVHLV